MVKRHAIGLTCGVTCQTSSIRIYITSHGLVLIIGLRILVTGDANHLGIVSSIVMAIDALCPLSIVTSAVNGEIQAIVVKSSRHPGIFIVTRCTIRRKLSRRMVGIGSSYIVGIVASVTGIRCIVVSRTVTRSTIIGDSSVSPIQWVILIVNREGSRCPTRCGGVTHGTIGRDVECHVVGFYTRREVIHVAIYTNCCSTLITAGMTLNTVYTHMASCQREGSSVMVK